MDDLSTAVDGQLPFDPPLETLVLDDGNIAPIRPDTGIDGFTLTTVAPGGSAHLVYVNESLADLLGYEVSELVGSCPSVLVHPRTPEPQLDAIAEIVEAGAQAVVRLHLARADGRPVQLEGRFVRIPTLDGSPLYLATYRDPGRSGTERPVGEGDRALGGAGRDGAPCEVSLEALAVEGSHPRATIAHQALHDPLTDLPNRTLVMDRLEQAVARLGRDQGALAVLVIDIDRFTVVNDVHGFVVGDRVLVEVSQRLRAAVRQGDTVGRLGGDEYVAVCVAIDAGTDVSAMAQRMIEAVAEPIAVDDLVVRVTASVGVAAVTRPGSSAASVISSAESALQRAAAGGPGRWALYDEGSRQRIVVRHEVERALHLAITEAELLLHYQPVVDLGSGRMVGAEALIRWDRPGYGLLPPAAFVDIAEETGLIVPVGRWAIDEVCHVLASWTPDAAGRRPVLSIDLSARQLCDPSLVGTVITALERHGLQPGCLGFEVTENVRVDDLEAATSSLRRLSALGCVLAIDDFGVGYASLDYLRRFPMAHAMKIGRSFISGLGTSRQDTAIVTASVALARTLGLAVIAEGVERAEQLTELRALGVELAQGHAISPPVPLSDARALWEVGQLLTIAHD